jgi:hypothetical protein
VTFLRRDVIREPYCLATDLHGWTQIRNKSINYLLPISVDPCPSVAYLGLLINPSRASATANRPARLSRHHFSLREYPQEIFTQNLADVLFAVSALQ